MANYQAGDVCRRLPALGRPRRADRVFPPASAPTGVTYLGRFEFDGNAKDASGHGINLTLYNSPPFEPRRKSCYETK